MNPIIIIVYHLHVFLKYLHEGWWGTRPNHHYFTVTPVGPPRHRVHTNLGGMLQAIRHGYACTARGTGYLCGKIVRIHGFIFYRA